jgi:hypothetical protein
MCRNGRVGPVVSHRWSVRNQRVGPVGRVRTRADAMRQPAGDVLTLYNLYLVHFFFLYILGKNHQLVRLPEIL